MAKSSDRKSEGPYTPTTSPTKVGQESGGEYQWRKSSATPVKK
jgi:hypothetical protein